MPVSYNPPVTEFLTKEQRNQWFTSKQAFLVTEACEVPGTYGRSARYKLQPVDAKTGEITGDAVYMSLTLENQSTGAEIARRVDELAWFVSVLADDSVGPLILSQVESGKGNPAWGFAAAK